MVVPEDRRGLAFCSRTVTRYLIRGVAGLLHCLGYRERIVHPMYDIEAAATAIVT